MNVDTGRILLWDDLTPAEKESGRWVKLGDDEFARAEPIAEHERTARLDEIFGKKRGSFGPHDFGKQR